MHTPREKLDYQVHTSLTEKERDRLNDAAKRLGLSRSELIRICTLNELPKMLDRESKRAKRRTP